MTDEQIAKLLEAARLYRRWAKESGDYPNDELGCLAHKAVIGAVTEIDGDVVMRVPFRIKDWVDGVWTDVEI